MGSKREARNVGLALAAIATKMSAATAPAKTAASVVSTPKSWEAIARLSANPATGSVPCTSKDTMALNTTFPQS